MRVALRNVIVPAALLGGAATAGMLPEEDSPGDAAGIPPWVAADAYTGAPPNGIPTPRCDNDDAPDLYSAINRLLGLGPGDPLRLASNADADARWVRSDEIWRDLEGTVAFVGLSARYRNSLGVYVDPGVGRERRTLLEPKSGFGFAAAGTEADPFPAVSFSIAPGERFGWFLDVDGAPLGGPRILYFSEAALNPGGWDRMFTYALGPLLLWVDRGEGAVPVHYGEAFLMGWEDMPGGGGDLLGDEDYDDMMFVVGRAVEVAGAGP